MTKKLFALCALFVLPVLLFLLFLAIPQPAMAQTCQITINPLTGLPDCKTGTGGGTAPTSPATNTFSAGATSVTVTHNYGFTATALCFIGTRASFVPYIPGGATTTTSSATTVNFLAAAPADGFCDVYANGGIAGTMVYPGAGVPNSTGSAWGTSYAVGTSANNLVQLNGSAQLPAVSAALLTNFPTLNQNTTGSAATLTTPRSIYGNNFDGSAAISNAAIGVGTGTSLALTGALTAASVSTGTSPPAITAGTGGVEALGEGTAPSAGCPAAGVDCIYADATAHALKASYNNDTASRIARYSDALSAFAISPLTTRGDLLTVNSTPALARLAKGTQYQTLQGGATDPGWDAVHLDQATAVTGTLPGANMTAMVGDSGSGGTKGAVPAPAAGDAAAGKFLKADATWAVPPGGGSGCATSGSSGQVLTDNGSGGCGSNAGFTYSTGAATLGTAGSLVGKVVLKNATSGDITLQPTTGALGTITTTIPAVTGTVAVAATSTTATQALFATSTAGAPAYRAVATTDLPTATNSGGFGASFDGGGSAITVNSTAYMTIPYACTIAASNIMVDTGTLTFKVWRAAAGTAIPTSGGSINTSGIAISTGTALRTTTTSDYTDTTLDINDLLAITLTAVSGATKAQIFVECNR